MLPEVDDFEFNRISELNPQRVGVVLSAIDNLPENLEVATIEPLSPENQISVDMMSEIEVVQFLQTFVLKHTVGNMTRDDLHSHLMFQAVLARAREIENSRD